jgi:hypothetical protein
VGDKSSVKDSNIVFAGDDRGKRTAVDKSFNIFVHVGPVTCSLPPSHQTIFE